MKKLALSLVAFAVVLIPASAEATPDKAQNDCVVAALTAGDFRGVFACLDDGPTASAIDWD